MVSPQQLSPCDLVQLSHADECNESTLGETTAIASVLIGLTQSTSSTSYMYLNDVKANILVDVSPAFLEWPHDVVNVLRVIEKDVGRHLNDGGANLRVRILELFQQRRP